MLIVDDHDDYRELLELFVEDMPDLTIWGEAASGRDALARLAAADESDLPGVILVDVRMPGMNGIELVAELRAGWPSVPCLMLSAHPPEQYAERALEAGASACVYKGHLDEVIGEIRRVATSL